ncbi:CAP domain-containing protein [Acetohalobium arabaticum]|uniref:SCP-like extracellular n=1 Tax=Acetohalobium arabaticum (strain ATCC 49924 / DSM 5501 / Z-7288) TaxID=574087 RepID=D9QST1_ACEAZ|nr:CAP domain-containing protein [Acetohalobium arabaticum]ADL11619.1 SCP-like extracellular [Acetohalobium arabaticum DSM 5501]
MRGDKYIASLLIIVLLLPSLMVLFWTGPVYAVSGLDNLESNSSFLSVLKGLVALFILNKIIGNGDSASAEPPQEDDPTPIDNGDNNSEDNVVIEEPGDNEDSSYSDQKDNSSTDETATDWTEMEVTSMTSAEAEMLQLLNQERTQRGLEPLQVDLRLVQVARAKSQNMIDEDYFAHQSPTLGSPFDMMQALNISYDFAGENIAGAGTVARAHKHLMESPGHRENILRPRFTHVGIGIIEGGPYGMMFSQEFIDK